VGTYPELSGISFAQPYIPSLLSRRPLPRLMALLMRRMYMPPATAMPLLTNAMLRGTSSDTFHATRQTVLVLSMSQPRPFMRPNFPPLAHAHRPLQTEFGKRQATRDLFPPTLDTLSTYIPTDLLPQLPHAQPPDMESRVHEMVMADLRKLHCPTPPEPTQGSSSQPMNTTTSGLPWDPQGLAAAHISIKPNCTRNATREIQHSAKRWLGMLLSTALDKTISVRNCGNWKRRKRPPPRKRSLK
jgi:hypothetical protein